MSYSGSHFWTLPHPLYSLNSVPFDFHKFGKLRKLPWAGNFHLVTVSKPRSRSHFCKPYFLTSPCNLAVCSCRKWSAGLHVCHDTQLINDKSFCSPGLGEWLVASSQVPDFCEELLPSLPVPCLTDLLCHGTSSPFPLLISVPPPNPSSVYVSPIPRII